MRTLLFTAGLLIAFAFTPPTSQAEDKSKETSKETSEQVAAEQLPAPIVITPELVEAHQAYQLAQLRWQQYRFVELPRQRQLLDNQVRLSESALQVLRRRIRDYRPFLQVGRYSPVRTAAENDHLALQATEQQLRQLRLERANLVRFSWQNSQLYELEVLRTAAQVLATQKSAQTVAASSK